MQQLEALRITLLRVAWAHAFPLLVFSLGVTIS